MLRYLIFFIIIMFSCFRSNAQESVNMIEILNIKKDMNSLEKRILKMIKKNPDIAKTKDLKLFHILYLGIEDANSLTKEDYLNHTYLQHLYYFRTNVKNPSGNFDIRLKYICTHTLITDSKGNLVARGDAFRVTPTDNDSNDAIRAKMFFDKEIDFAFRIVYLGCRYEFGIRKDKLYVFGWEKAVFDDVFVECEFVKYTWEEFVECCLDNCIK